MTRTAAKRPPMRPTPSEQPRVESDARKEINRLLAQLAVKPEEDGLPTAKFDTWRTMDGLYAGDARYLQEVDGRLSWWSVTAQNARTVAEAEQTVLDVVRLRASGMV